MAEIICANMTA